MTKNTEREEPTVAEQENTETNRGAVQGRERRLALNLMAIAGGRDAIQGYVALGVLADLLVSYPEIARENTHAIVEALIDGAKEFELPESNPFEEVADDFYALAHQLGVDAAVGRGAGDAER